MTRGVYIICAKQQVHQLNYRFPLSHNRQIDFPPSTRAPLIIQDSSNEAWPGILQGGGGQTIVKKWWHIAPGFAFRSTSDKVESICILRVSCSCTDEEYYQMPQLFHLDEYVGCKAMGGAYCLGSFELSAPDDNQLYRFMQVCLTLIPGFARWTLYPLKKETTVPTQSKQPFAEIRYSTLFNPVSNWKPCTYRVYNSTQKLLKLRILDTGKRSSI